jgi:uncharacterized membrane protein HdeD (DUF308 family)
MNDQLTHSNNPPEGSGGAAIFTGILLILLGILALGAPILLGMSVAIMVGISLVVGGISLLVYGFKAGLGIWPYILGILAVAAGVYLFMNPQVAAGTLTVFICAYLLFAGISEVALSWQVRPAEGWGWMLISGILSIILSAMLWGQFPFSGPMAIGILIGIKLLFSGVAVMMLGFAAKKMTSA